ncbi:maleylpyruvate isomerase family mycothiol-dependent enzyme [Nocardioides sp. GXZ039]|uniref:maleylpyruvate isomerase family mycothiol-dependent enzyme n=1 Tax=Nocardioides sp. GXZ039 TaxID=3136018 RepID=UPI0030F3FC7E
MDDGDDSAELGGYIEVWWRGIDDFTSLLEKLGPEEWSAATDLEGWTVRDVAAHIAHLEALLAGTPHDDQVDVGEPAHVRNPMGTFTEQGVAARRERTGAELVAEIRDAAGARHRDLLATPPTDAAAPAAGAFGALGWDTRTLLSNRPVDLWMHEQDVRRAVGRAGGLDSPGAEHTTRVFLRSLPVVVGKRVAPPPGTTVVLDVEGAAPVAVEVGADGRAAVVEAPADPTTRIRLTREAHAILAGGRRPADQVAQTSDVVIEGDQDLARAVLDKLAVTP